MSKFNIGHITGVTVNGTEALVNKVKEDVPAAKDATKRKFKGWKDSVKAEYKKVREGEEGVIETEVVFGHGNASAQQNAFRFQQSIATQAIELTTGKENNGTH